MKKLNFKTKLSPRRSNFDIDQLTSFLKENGGNHVSHLIFLQDKEIYWAEQQKVLIAYKRIANKLVVLGDPIGEERYILKAIKEFHEYSKNQGLTPIFYQITPKFMAYYHETGHRFLKLGEEGLVNLQHFSLAGKQGAKLRTRVNKFARNSYTFSVVYPPYSKELLSELKQVSDSWLGKQKEKGFSVVSFSEEYVSCFPLALLSAPDGSIIAFATLATDYRKTISIDLMRKSSDSPHGTMDVLFIHIFNWAKDNGYETCSLGMAPLSNVGKCKHSFINEKIIRLAYLHGNSLYKFKGLKEFKSKFACTWEPKYLAYKKTFLSTALIQLILLINNRPIPKYKVIEKIIYLFSKAG
ncbi:MAG TPA: phosphatidylglycerol lysyltransferase domain-containing protein [Chondromyces sp.]|nr:phosphatidylglycerol lysyltransferase domain-containing protein [Chondromyces sp.]